MTKTVIRSLLILGMILVGRGAAAQDEASKLLWERLAILQEIVELRTVAFKAGESDLKSVLEAQKDVSQAKVELSKSMLEQIAALEELVKNAKQIEETIGVMVEQGIGPRVDLLSAKAFRLRAEADLARVSSRK